jgi:hypothetical protein
MSDRAMLDLAACDAVLLAHAWDPIVFYTPAEHTCMGAVHARTMLAPSNGRSCPAEAATIAIKNSGRSAQQQRAGIAAVSSRFPVLTVPHEHTVRYLNLVPVSESRPATATPCMFSELARTDDSDWLTSAAQAYSHAMQIGFHLDSGI